MGTCKSYITFDLYLYIVFDLIFLQKFFSSGYRGGGVSLPMLAMYWIKIGVFKKIPKF